MNEPVENSVDYVNNSPEEAPAPLTWRDAAAPILALILAFLFWAVFAVRDMGYFGPGLGVPVFVLAYFGAVLLMLGKRARFTPGSLALMGASLALSLCCWLYTLLGLTILNCFLILFTAAGATFLLSGHGRFGPLDGRILPETVRLSFTALFTKVSQPFRLLGRMGRSGKGLLGRVILSLLLCLPLLGVVLALLASADAVFESLFTRLGDRLMALSLGETVWKLLRAVVLALFIASGLCFVASEPGEQAPPPAEAKERHPLPFLLPTVLLDGVYLLFCAIQLKYLFGGAEAAAMAGGWADYAREGFFQLVAVAAINLGLCLLGCRQDRFAAKGGLALRIADGLMLLCTAVILLSALRRMQLYILAYGMSVLRLMTLWGMLAIFVGLLAAGWKLIRPRFSFFSVFGAFALTTWCLFCLANPGGIIADHNVDRYLSGELESVDTYYLERLGTDALPALYRLSEATGEGEYAISAAERHAGYESGWTQHKLSYRFLPED